VSHLLVQIVLPNLPYPALILYSSRRVLHDMTLLLRMLSVLGGRRLRVLRMLLCRGRCRCLLLLLERLLLLLRLLLLQGPVSESHSGRMAR